jgi:hypothetical protein
VLYRITRRKLVQLDSTEGVPGRRYRQLRACCEDIEGNAFTAVTYIAEGKEKDGNSSLRYLTLLRDGARAHKLPEHLRCLESVKHALLMRPLAQRETSSWTSWYCRSASACSVSSSRAPSARRSFSS